MSLVNRTIVGAIWSVATRLGARLIGLVSTLIITRYLSPEVLGEVGVAIVACATAHFATDLAFGQYIVVKSKDNQAAVFHALFYTLLSTALLALLLVVSADTLGELFGVENINRYLPVIALAIVLERIGRIPGSLALRDLRFKLFTSVSAVSELVYAVVSVGMAALGYGGDSIVWANVAQWGLWALCLGVAVGPTWLKPCRITWADSKRMLDFGLPVALSSLANKASSSWDRLVVTYLFGTRIHGVYGLAKGLGSVPADNVGDAVGDVLMPSFVRMTADEARVAVVRSCHIVAVVVFPLTVGLAAVAPTLVQALFTPEWHETALPLTILAAVSLIDPLGDTMTSYLKARDRPWSVMVVQTSYLVVMLGSVFVLGSIFGLAGACFGIGVGMCYRALASLHIAKLSDGVSTSAMLLGLGRVGLASGVMALVVVAVRETLTTHLSHAVWALIIEILVGALTYPVCAFLIAGPFAKEIVRWIREVRADRS